MNVLKTQICVTRPQCVNDGRPLSKDFRFFSNCGVSIHIFMECGPTSLNLEAACWSHLKWSKYP